MLPQRASPPAVAEVVQKIAACRHGCPCSGARLHEVLRLPVRKDRRSRQAALGEVHAAYRSLVCEQSLAARGASARRGVSTVG